MQHEQTGAISHPLIEPVDYGEPARLAYNMRKRIQLEAQPGQSPETPEGRNFRESVLSGETSYQETQYHSSRVARAEISPYFVESDVSNTNDVDNAESNTSDCSDKEPLGLMTWLRAVTEKYPSLSLEVAADTLLKSLSRPPQVGRLIFDDRDNAISDDIEYLFKQAEMFDKRYEEILSKFEGKFVFCIDGEVLDSADDEDELLARVDSAYGYGPHFIEFVGNDDNTGEEIIVHTPFFE